MLLKPKENFGKIYYRLKKVYKNKFYFILTDFKEYTFFKEGLKASIEVGI